MQAELVRPNSEVLFQAQYLLQVRASDFTLPAACQVIMEAELRTHSVAHTTIDETSIY